ncbi:MAG: phage major capsid protein, partial [Clostridia bacterium]|nr:phage major capsid protein [Clostridia bacterium]
VYQGMQEANILPNLVASVTEIDSMDYRSVISNPTEDEKSTKIVMEGTLLPKTEIKAQENLVKLHKRGRMLVASYETLKYQKLDLFTVTLKQIGAYITKTLTDDAIDVLLNGDGNNNAIRSIQSDEQGLSYESLLRLWAEISPYNLNTLIANTNVMQSVLSLNEMKDATAGLNFQGTGNMITPMGANLIHVASAPENTIIGLDKNYSLEMVTNGGIMTEFDKLIDRQLERASISCIAGFAKIFNDACLKLDIN